MGKRIELSKKTITEDKDGNASITGKVSTEGAIVDAKDLTTKEYVDNAIAQASIGGEVDTSGFALKTELPTKTSQLTNDSGFITSIPDEYVTSSELQQTLQPYDQELNEIYDWIETDFAKKDELFSGDYNDLSNKPVIPSIQGLASEAYVNNKLANLQLVKITQAEYDALETKDPNTLYLIVE